MMRIAISTWTFVRDAARTVAPSLLMTSAVMLAFLLGDLNVSPWLTFGPFVIGSAALGMAIDRAENRASIKWANKFWSLIESDHVVEVTVTHKNRTETTA